MKPLNLDNRPCSPVSSNCVVWQGPDISCINICKGDTVSDVVAALATELCTILDQTNVTNYDLSCLGITECGPKDFNALIQLLIDKICELQDITPTQPISTGTCPDCIVQVASCFRIGNVTTMQLLDYVQMIAEKLCALLLEISSITDQISELTIRVEQLENTPVPKSDTPSFTLSCDVGGLASGSIQTINTILFEFINNVWCDYYAATGSTSDLISAVNAICINDSDLQLTTGTPFSANPNWIQSGSYNTIADAINNLWVALCDTYTATSEISLTVEDSNSIDLTYSSGILSAKMVDSDWQDLEGFSFYTGSMVGSKPQCRRIGNQIHFRGQVTIPIADGAGAAVPLAATDTYWNVYRALPFVGGSGIIYDAQNRLLFNSNGASALSVIPSNVLDAGTLLDNQYQGPQFLATRKINVQDSGAGVLFGAVTLTAAVDVSILANKTLRITPLNTIEAATTDTYSFEGNSLFRSLTSSFSSRSRVINFREYVKNLDGNMSMNQVPLINSSTIIGNLYRIIDYQIGDNFTNVGAVLNGNDCTFIATGTTPTTWVNGTQLVNLTQALFYNGFNNSNLGSQWPLMIDLPGTDFDAGRNTNLGGFQINLDGLIAYLDPCNIDLKSYSCAPLS